MQSQGIQLPSGYEVPDIPSGCRVFRVLPYALILPELVFGCWIWILVAATRVYLPIHNGWVMYVAASSFLFSLILLFIYVCGLHKNNCGTWRIVDAIYHGIAAMFTFSAAVTVTGTAIVCNDNIPFATCSVVYYHLLSAASVFAYVNALLYMLHSFYSYIN
ncbi:hypothetical protein GDO86_009322 [Hymenochirus boettgeri]|uniref:MARVEL domain-containing protein n=1 Tax=Hymenochirus boettgeri TaxID=247094 RepID=A0A8T2JL84_9PIPI|nr:hypothetical protein GDO86_009322 [Hymenochirus boettgeri]